VEDGADLVNADLALVIGHLDHAHVRMAVLANETAAAAVSAGRGFTGTVEGLREGASQSELANGLGAGEEEGVGDTTRGNAMAQKRDGRFVPDDGPLAKRWVIHRSNRMRSS
jgi:hypothetical protein